MMVVPILNLLTPLFGIALMVHVGLILGLMSVLEATMTLPGIAGIVLLVGPEGGLSPAETDACRAAGFVAVQLGPRVLRTETAGGRTQVSIRDLGSTNGTFVGGEQIRNARLADGESFTMGRTTLTVRLGSAP